jgi:hypothetical protein
VLIGGLLETFFFDCALFCRLVFFFLNYIWKLCRRCGETSICLRRKMWKYILAMKVRAEPWSGKGQFYLVGKLLADRVVPKDLLRVHMKRAWKILGSVSFKVLGENLFVIEFEHDWERIQVLVGRPWIFDGNLFAVAE